MIKHARLDLGALLSSAAFLPPLSTFLISTAHFPSLHHHDTSATSATSTTSNTTRQALPPQQNQSQHHHQDSNNRNAAISARSADASV
ncbi:hypothetical protein JCM8097_006367 [Rhodosporidiobolus ruineniae]